MKKYLVIFQISLNRALAYRGVSVVFNTLFLINAFLNLAVWTVVLKSPEYRSTESFATFITYYIILLFVHQLIQSYTGGMIANEHIKHGELSIYLLRPFPYLIFMYILELPWRLIQFLFSIPFAMVLIYFFHSIIKINIGFIILGIFIFPLAFTLSFLIQVFIAQFTFWFDDATGFLNAIEVLTLLFSGAGIPIFFLPPVLQQIGSLLPFQYAMYFPIATIANRLPLNVVIINYLILIVWVFVLGSVDIYLWKKGLTKFTGEGI
ncbi:MAG: ABC-2 family transporter protein [Patescibacteria group bacterium]